MQDRDNMQGTSETSLTLWVLISHCWLYWVEVLFALECSKCFMLSHQLQLKQIWHKDFQMEFPFNGSNRESVMSVSSTVITIDTAVLAPSSTDVSQLGSVPVIF